MVVGPVMKPSGGRPGALAAPDEREKGMNLIRRHVMRTLATAGHGSAAAFKEAYQYDPRAGGWIEVAWVRRLVDRAAMFRHSHGDPGLKAAIAIAAAGTSN